MPFILPFVPLITAGIGAAGLADTIYNQVSQPGAPPGPSPSDITKQAVTSEQANRATATKQAAQFLPQLQSDTSGGLSPDAYKELSSTFSGNANLSNSPQMQEMVAKFLGLDTGASFGGDQPFGSGSGSNPLSPGLAG